MYAGARKTVSFLALSLTQSWFTGEPLSLSFVWVVCLDKDVAVTARRQPATPPLSGVTCAPATGRRGEPGTGKDKSKTDNRCSVCCSNSQDGTGAVVLFRWKVADEVCAQLESLVKLHARCGLTDIESGGNMKSVHNERSWSGFIKQCCL
jgi:hypothetical protein